MEQSITLEQAIASWVAGNVKNINVDYDTSLAMRAALHEQIQPVWDYHANNYHRDPKMHKITVKPLPIGEAAERMKLWVPWAFIKLQNGFARLYTAAFQDVLPPHANIDEMTTIPPERAKAVIVYVRHRLETAHVATEVVTDVVDYVDELAEYLLKGHTGVY